MWLLSFSMMSLKPSHVVACINISSLFWLSNIPLYVCSTFCLLIHYSMSIWVALLSHASKAMLKILQASLQQYVNHELPDVQAWFRKGRETRDQIANILCVIKKAREFQKNICFIDYAKTFDCVTHNKLWKILKEMGIPDDLTCLLRNLLVKKQQLEWDMQQQTDFKLGKEYIKAVYCPPAYLTSMQSTSCKMLGWMKHKLESRFPGEISITSAMQMTPSLWQKVKRK